MALSESGLLAAGVRVGQIAYGPAGKRKIIKPRKGPARGSTKVRSGKTQSFYVRPGRGRRR